MIEPSCISAEAQVRAEREVQQPGTAAATARSLYYASMGHTLRNPINAMTGFASVLLAEAGGPLTERQKEFVENILESGKRQLEIVNNLTTLAKLDAGQIHPDNSQVTISQLVSDAFDQFRSGGEAKGLSMEVRSSENAGVVVGDSALLTTAVVNLLSNAVRLTKSGGRIAVAVVRECSSQDASAFSNTDNEEQVLIEVSDTGPGISSDALDYIFDDFQLSQLASAVTPPSKGSGLAVARRIVEMHGGRIWAESSGIKGQGSKFFVVLPTQKQWGSTV